MKNVSRILMLVLLAIAFITQSMDVLGGGMRGSRNLAKSDFDMVDLVDDSLASTDMRQLNENMPTDYDYKGEYEIVFRQTYPFMYKNTNQWANALDYAATNPESPNFSILKAIEDYRCKTDGKFKLKLVYDGKLAGEWKQSSNPVTTMGKGNQVSLGYEGINVPKTRWSRRFQGLARNPNGRSFLDGYTGNPWVYSLGARVKWGNGYPASGMPKRATKIELYAFKDETDHRKEPVEPVEPDKFDSFCDCDEYRNGATEKHPVLCTKKKQVYAAKFG